MMTKADVIEFVNACDEDGGPEDRAEAAEMFEAMFGSAPRAEMSQVEIWSNVCEAVRADADSDSFAEWLAAAGIEDTGESEYDLRAAWRAGEEPSEYRTARTTTAFRGGVTTEVKMIVSGDGSIGWRLLDQCGADWSDLLVEVALVHAAGQLSPRDFARFQAACEQGYGPDADADVNGVRWVVPAGY